MSLKTIIIDDEPNAVELLAIRLSQHCPQVQIVATCTSSLAGVAAIKELQPDVLFLDIEMPQLNGFQVLEAVANYSFSLIFVTAYDKFAIKAFKYSAIDYLLKPIDVEELKIAVSKVEKSRNIKMNQISHFKENYQNILAKKLPEKIALPYQNGVSFENIISIIYCEADDNYTKFYLENDKHYLVTKTLKDIQETLEERGFMRVHRQFLVNLNQIKKYVKGEGNYLVMNNNVSIPVSRSQKDRLVEYFGWL